MEFGKWELRDNSYTSYYFSKDAMLYPSSNSTDEGKLHTEENVRNIYRDLTNKNFVIKYNYFSLSLNPSRNGVIVSPGEAVIQGYHFYTKNTAEVKVPDNTVYNEDGTFAAKQVITQYTLGISLSYDAANHVTGDVVNKEAAVGESEVFSGVYVAWFDECQLECNYKNILVLGRAWVQSGKIVADGTLLDNERIIYHGFEADPFKDHRFDAFTVEVEVHGHKTTKYDTLRDNMTQIHEPLYTYDSMHFPVELDRQDRTKPPSFVTDIQDYVNHLPDWYVSKYGDYMTGALRFNNLSIDAKREFKDLKIIKDSTESEYSDSVFISPRTYGDLTRTLDKKVELDTLKDFNYSVGGTIMTIVPDSYRDSTDWNNGYTGIHAALVSQLNGETGLRLHFGKGSNEHGVYDTTRIVHYGIKDDGQTYDKGHSENRSKFIIENTDEKGRKASINIKNGEIFIDSIVNPAESLYNEEMLDNGFVGEYQGSGIQFQVSGYVKDELTNNIDFRIDRNYISMANHKYVNHRTGKRGTQQSGQFNDDLHFTLGCGISYDSIKGRNKDTDILTYDVFCNNENSDPYMTLGNLRVRSNVLYDENNNRVTNTKQTTVELLNHIDLPFLRIRPRVYSEQYIAEELFQVGTRKYDDLINNEAQNSTLDRIIMKKVGLSDLSNFDAIDSLTYFEQDFSRNTNERKIINKMMPTINVSGVPGFEEIAGIYSYGNIGCSSEELKPGSSNEESINDISNDPYNKDAEWVRFTRFRYDNDKDQVNGGTYIGNHEDNKGRLWGETYNLEFNTNVANRRANQIIWRYNGSTGSSVKEDGTPDNTLENTPPVILSYIHDNTNATSNSQGTYTRYTNVEGTLGNVDGHGTFETWMDHAGVTHYNPTYKTRDFLLLENAGLVVSGDINNPSLCGDTLNTNNHLGVTIVAGRVYNAVYNDFAETFEKSNKDEFAKPGTLISLDAETGKYKICDEYSNKLVVGVQSNTYAFLAGGNRVNGAQDVLDLENEYFTVALSGKVWVNVTSDSYITPGDMLCSSFEKGRATKTTYDTPGTIIGKALSEPKYFAEDDEYKVLMLVITR